jgi:hypothetical protein
MDILSRVLLPQDVVLQCIGFRARFCCLFLAFSLRIVRRLSECGRDSVTQPRSSGSIICAAPEASLGLSLVLNAAIIYSLLLFAHGK